MADPHKILGIAPDASVEQIQKAYRRRATKYHPDAGGDAWAFQQVQEAYEQLMRARGQSGPATTKKPASDRSPGRAAAPKPDPKPSTSVHPKAVHAVNSKTNKSNASEPKATKPGLLPYWLRHLLTGELPLQNEVTTFILVSVLDIFMTYMLLRVGAVEANPFARFFLDRWGFDGMIAFKMVTVAVVTVLAQVVAQFQMSTARKLLIYSTVIVGAVVIYSGGLLFRTVAG